MSNIIPFPGGDGKLPAYLRQANIDNSEFRAGVSSGFPVLSIKGKTWAIVRDGERNLVTKPDDDDEPASFVELVMLRANINLSKVYYSGGYEDGAQEKPTCYSNDGVKPAADAQDPQCKTCAACPHNIWGSGANGKGKACSDSRRVAVAKADRLDDPMLLRVPPASLKGLAEYSSDIASRNLPMRAVVTRIKFDPNEATPKLVFKPVGLLEEAEFSQADEAAESEVVEQIIGVADDSTPARLPSKVKVTEEDVASVVPDDEDDEEEEAPKPKPKRAAKKAPAKKATPKPAPVEDDEDEEEAPAPKKAKPAAKVEEEDDPFDGLDDLLGDFDD